MGYKKIECVICGYQMASQAKEPRCTMCGSRRVNGIESFRTSKPHKDMPMREDDPAPAETVQEPKTESETMPKQKKSESVEEKKPENAAPKQPEKDDFDQWLDGD